MLLQAFRALWTICVSPGVSSGRSIKVPLQQLKVMFLDVQVYFENVLDVD
jgi:hypothetical protein